MPRLQAWGPSCSSCQPQGTPPSPRTALITAPTQTRCNATLGCAFPHTPSAVQSDSHTADDTWHPHDTWHTLHAPCCRRLRPTRACRVIELWPPPHRVRSLGRCLPLASIAPAVDSGMPTAVRGRPPLPPQLPTAEDMTSVTQPSTAAPHTLAFVNHPSTAKSNMVPYRPNHEPAPRTLPPTHISPGSASCRLRHTWRVLLPLLQSHAHPTRHGTDGPNNSCDPLHPLPCCD